jgi:hypothetical protein
MDADEKKLREGLRKRIHAMHGDIEAAAVAIDVHHTTLSRWGNLNYNGLPNVLHLLKLAQRWNLSPAYLSFGQGPDTLPAWNAIAAFGKALRLQPEPVQQHLFSSLKLPYTPLPPLDEIRFTAAAVARRLASAKPPTPRAQEAPAHYGRRIDAAALKRICAIVAGYVAHNPPQISLSEADGIRDVLALLQSIADDLPNRPADRGHADEPNAGDATATDATQDPPQNRTKDDTD